MSRWKLTQQSVLITGAANGIGRAIALSLAKRGNALWLCDIDQKKLEHTAEQCREESVVVRQSTIDLSSPDQVAQLSQQIHLEWPQLSILINNAGISCYGSYNKFDLQQHNQLMQINLLAPMQLTHHLLPTLLQQERSHVVNIASMYGLFISNRSTTYHASKFGMVGFSLAMRAEYRRTPVQVNTICPGFVKTELYDHLMVTRRRTKKRHPPQWASSTPDQVASAVIRGIEGNKRLVLISTLARLGYWSTCLAPGLLDWLYSFGKKQSYIPAEQEVISLPISEAVHAEETLPHAAEETKKAA